MRRTRRLVVVAALLSVPLGLRAQASPPPFAAFGDSTFANLTLPPPFQCTPINDIVAGGRVFVSSGCGFLTGGAVVRTVTFDKFADLRPGAPIHYQNKTTAVAELGTGADAVSAALFGDVLTFTGPSSPTFVDFVLHEDGVVDTTAFGATTSLESCLGFYSALPTRALDACLTGTPLAPGGPVHTYGLGPVDTTYTFTFDLTPAPGQTTSSLAFFYALRSATSVSLVPGHQTYDGVADIDFINTASIVGLRLRDAAGNDITNLTTVTAASGATYALLPPAPTTSAPEPVPLALLAAGVTLLAVVGTRGSGLG